MLFTGDHVMSGSTVVIAPRRRHGRLHSLAEEGPDPGRDRPGPDPGTYLDDYVSHRIDRERQVAEALAGAGPDGADTEALVGGHLRGRARAAPPRRPLQRVGPRPQAGPRGWGLRRRRRRPGHHLGSDLDTASTGTALTGTRQFGDATMAVAVWPERVTPDVCRPRWTVQGRARVCSFPESDESSNQRLVGVVFRTSWAERSSVVASARSGRSFVAALAGTSAGTGVGADTTSRISPSSTATATVASTVSRRRRPRSRASRTRSTT